MNHAIDTQALSKQYRKLRALDSVSLQIPAGSIYGLFGANGAGKTTLLDLLMNLQSPSAGQAQVLGIDSRDLQGKHFQSIGYVSENQEYPGWMTIEYLMRYLRPFYPTWDQQLADSLLDQFGLPLDRKLKHLSRGMKMKACLASCMAYRPKLLVLDEPLSGLDPLTRDELIQALVASAEETTVLLSSHDIAEIETFVSHIGYLSNGQLQFSEEIGSVSRRFREITVTMDSVVIPDPWPTHWISQDQSEACVRFVDTRFDDVRTLEEIRLHFSDIKAVETAAMPLRSILLALGRIDRLSNQRSSARPASVAECSQEARQA